MTEIEKLDLSNIDWKSSKEFFQSLADELRDLDDRDERYSFTWVGKRKSIIEAGAPINKTLRPDREASKNFDATENLYIEGDNLDALKLLQESYLGKVKMIYDPPYNTGKDFVYHDNFTADNAQYAVASGKKDDEGNTLVAEDEFKKNERSAGRFHSDWLSMMYPRLKLARNLLTDDGVIFISIDDNEQANLKKLCDEVFGEDNFVAQLIWKSKSGGANDSQFFAVDHEYVVAYAKNANEFYLLIDTEATVTTAYNLADEKGHYSLDRLDKQSLGYLESLDFPIVGPDGKTYTVFHKNPQQKVARWRWGKETVKERYSELVFKDGNVYTKNYEKQGAIARSLLIEDRFGRTRTGKTDLTELLKLQLFDNPKPYKLVKFLLNVSTSDNDLILDFFSGSGTTAHAVMQLNAEDGGNRKFILVQLDEITYEGEKDSDGKYIIDPETKLPQVKENGKHSEAFKAGYRTIPEIARERIRRAGEKIAKEHPDAKVDYGFRTLKIDSANEKDVYKTPAETTQETLLNLVDNVKEDRTDLDLLYGVLVPSALELNRPLSVAVIASGAKQSRIYKYDYFGEVSGLVACFEPEITTDLVKEIAKLKPLVAVFRESSFSTGASKVNLYETLRVLSPETKVKVI